MRSVSTFPDLDSRQRHRVLLFSLSWRFCRGSLVALACPASCCWCVGSRDRFRACAHPAPKSGGSGSLPRMAWRVKVSGAEFRRPLRLPGLTLHGPQREQPLWRGATGSVDTQSVGVLSDRSCRRLLPSSTQETTTSGNARCRLMRHEMQPCFSQPVAQLCCWQRRLAAQRGLERRMWTTTVAAVLDACPEVHHGRVYDHDQPAHVWAHTCGRT